MQRRANDAQVERLLSALKRDLSYRQKMARRIAERDNIKYDSAMRRLQRYITTAGERRSFVRAPVEYQREIRQEARRVPLPPPPREPIRERPIIEPPPIPVRREREYEPPPPRYEYEPESEHTDLYELRAIIAHFDGDTREAGRALKVDSRLLDLASQGTVISRRMGAGKVDEGVERLYERLPDDERQEIQDFADLLRDLPDWQIGMILDDMAEGNSTFSDWIDAWYEDDMNIDSSQSNYWAVWREAYKRMKG